MTATTRLKRRRSSLPLLPGSPRQQAAPVRARCPLADPQGQRSRWESAATALLETVEQYFGYVGEPGTSLEGDVPAALLTAPRWKDNAELIEAIGTSEYLGGRVLDVTHGYGVFWKNWKPSELVACDIDPAKSPVGYSVDFTKLPAEWHEASDAIVCDPPYKLNGRADEKVDERYGVHVYARWQDRYDLIEQAIRECAAATKRYLLLKCMDQAASGAAPGDDRLHNVARESGMELVDRYDMLVDPLSAAAGTAPGARSHELLNHARVREEEGLEEELRIRRRHQARPRHCIFEFRIVAGSSCELSALLKNHQPRR